jgi:outer membrane protein assembly factor BamB
VLFNKSQTRLIQCPEGKGGSSTILNSVTSIGDYAFDWCTGLTGITIPNSVTSIGDGAFDWCSGLTAITVDPLNSAYSSAAGVLFNKSQTRLIQCPGGEGGSYTIPNSVTNIGDEAFFSCSMLTNVTIGNSITSIGKSAFSYCSMLANVTIPDSVTSIGDSAFSSCFGLTSLTIGNSVASIGDWAFSDCSMLANVTIPDSVTSIGDAAFSGCYGLTSLTIGNSVASIGDWAFSYCSMLANVTMPNSVTNIGDYALSSCSSLTGVCFQGSAPNLGSDVFADDNNVTVYYLAGTTGWGPTFGGRPTLLWNPLVVQPSAGTNGSISPNTPQTLYSGASVSFTASPNPGYEVHHWLLDGSVVQTGGTSYTLFSIHTDHNVQVTFRLKTAAWPMLGHDSLHTGQSEYTEKAFGELKWRYQMGSVASSPAVGFDGAVYVGSGDKYLYALNPNGTLKWRYQTSWGVSTSPAIAADGTVYVSSGDNYLYALNPDGTLKWRYQMSDYFSTSPAIATDGTVYVGSYALNPNGTLKWRCQMRGDVTTSPAIGSDGTVYVGTSEDALYALNPDGTVKWAHGVCGVPSSPAIAADGTVYVGGENNLPFTCLDALNPDGTVKWSYPVYDYDIGSPAIGSDGTVYVGFGGYLYALNPDGTVKWRYQTSWGVSTSPAIAADGTVFFATYGFGTCALNPDGTFKWSYEGYGTHCSPAIAADGTVYVSSDDNYLDALHLQSHGAVYGIARSMASGVGAAVTMSAVPGTNSISGAGGYYSLNLAPGTCNLTITGAGYQTLTIPSVLVKVGDVTPLDILVPTTGPLNLTRQAFVPASVGQSFTDRAWVAGGSYPYVLSVSYGTLPPGCALDTVAGFITGTPTTPGSYTFAIGVRDQQNTYAEREYTIDVTAPLAFTATALPRATKNALYLYDFPITGGLPPYSVIKESGSLPTGVNLSATGRLIGTPTNTGSTTFTAEVTDTDGRILRQNFSLFVDDPLSISTSYLNTGITGQPYSQTLQGMGGYGGYTWSLYSGTLPQGINLDPGTGVLSGTPQAAAAIPLLIMVEDSVGRQASKTLTLVVTAPLAFVTTTLPDGAMNESYSEQVRVSGGLAPYQFTYTGMLPTGLSLNQTNGIISGTPTAAMLNNIQITVTDSSLPTPQTVTATLALRVTSTLTINTPAVLPTAPLGQIISPIVLHAVSGISPYYWSLTGGALPPGISFAAATAQLTGTPTAPGDFVFTITVTDSKQPEQTATKEFIWHVVDVQPPVLTITAPTAGQFWSNAVFTVNGTVADNGPVAAVSYQLNGGAWNPAQTANGWSNWTATVTLVGGTNTVRAYAVDAGGNISLTNSVNFVYVVSDRLTLVANPQAGGTVTGVLNGQLLAINQVYSATAQSNGTGGFVFSNWTTCAGEVLTNKPVIRFVMQSNLCLQANFVDVARPTLAITAPTANQRWSNAPLFTVRGTAKDNVQVSNVWCQANNGVWGAATLGTGRTNWAIDVALVRSTNTARAYAEDAAGNRSLTNSVSFVYVMADRLSVVATGKGTISPNYSNAWLEIGRQYSMTAKASSGYAFTNWVISTNWVGGVATNNATVQFMMQSNLTLQVNFADVTRPTIAITSPKPGQKVNAVMTATGTASDNAQVAAVKYQLNSNAWAVATGTTSWSAAMSLLKGTNVLRAYALDASGNKSTTNLVTFVSTNDFQMSLSVGSAQPLTGAGLDLYLQVTPGLNCRIESSTDLVFWTTFTNFVGTNVPMHFGDPAAPNYDRRFYRAVSP